MAMPVFWLWPTPPSTARTMRMYSDLVSRSSREVVVISPAGDGVQQGGLGWSGRGQGGRASQSMKERHLQDQMIRQCVCACMRMHVYAEGGSWCSQKEGDSTQALGTGTQSWANITP